MRKPVFGEKRSPAYWHGTSAKQCPWLGLGTGVRQGAREGKADPAPGMEACPVEVLGSAVKVTLGGQPHLEDYVNE